MTTYFDTMSRNARDAFLRGSWDELHEVEKELVRDITLAIELPGFPEDLRLAAHRALLGCAVVTLPEGLTQELKGWGDPPDIDDYSTWLGESIHALHTIFHAYARRTGESDGPLRRVSYYLTRGDDAREAIYKAVQKERGTGPWNRAAIQNVTVEIPDPFVPKADP